MSRSRVRSLVIFALIAAAIATVGGLLLSQFLGRDGGGPDDAGSPGAATATGSGAEATDAESSPTAAESSPTVVTAKPSEGASAGDTAQAPPAAAAPTAANTPTAAAPSSSHVAEPTSAAPAPSTDPTTSAPAPGPPGVDITTPSSLQVVVNKTRPLSPQSYRPADLRAVSGTDILLRTQAASALEQLRAAAAAEGHRLTVVSGFRSVEHQRSAYQHWVNQYGQAHADTVSARPGYSEHQTGLAADLGDAATPGCDLRGCFGETAAGVWLAQNAGDYGFIIRYPQGATGVTGYTYEPWHVRYLGTGHAAQVKAAGGVLETAWGLPAAPDYR
ncbi:MAG: M15 family metallopeptidase [Micrococcus sp.]|nr:M15 family metallopeptidase [Micrococcus sp.]